MSTPMPEPTPTDPGMQPPQGQPDGQQPEGDDQQQPERDYDALLAETRKWEQRAKQNIADAKRARELEKELTQYREQNQSETEKAINAARREAEKETTARYTRQIATAEIRAAAGGKLQDPADAVRLIDLDEYIAQDGSVDTDGIHEAIAQLVKDKPYLAAQQAPKTPRFDSGQRSGAGAVEPDFNDTLRKGFRRK